jgi:hypothetical protein
MRTIQVDKQPPKSAPRQEEEELDLSDIPF